MVGTAPRVRSFWGRAGRTSVTRGASIAERPPAGPVADCRRQDLRIASETSGTLCRRVAEEVAGDPRHANPLAGAFDQFLHCGCGESAATRVKQELMSLIDDEQRAEVSEPLAQRGFTSTANRHQPFFIPFSEHLEVAIAQMRVGCLQVAQLGYAEPAIEDREGDGVVPRPEGVVSSEAAE